MSMMPGLAQAAMPDPILDQLQISIWNGMEENIVLPEFIKAFGKPWLHKKNNELNFSNGIAISSQEKMGYRLVRFPAFPPVLAALNPVLKLFPKRFDGKPAAQLRSAEIAWDFPISHRYTEAEEQLIMLAPLAVPANKFARMRVMEPDEYSEVWFKRCADGAINGIITYYLKSLSRQPDKEDPSITKLAPTPHAVWRGIIYCKKLAPNEPWCIRFEATLLGQRLEKVIGKSLPSDLTRLPRRLAGLCFDDFWRFERFNWLAFMEAARRSADYKKIPFDGIEKSAIKYHAMSMEQGIRVTIRLKRGAKKIAAMLKSKSLRNRISAKKFSTPLALMEVLPLTSPDK
jgi:hypothetical protein